MGHFAYVKDGKVLNIIVAEQDFIDTYPPEEQKCWVRTSYNTRGGVYYKPDSNEPHEDQSLALRKNHPGIGFTYDAALDAFIPPKPSQGNWVLNVNTCLWEEG